VLSDHRGGFLHERKSEIHATNVVAAGGEAAEFKSALLDISNRPVRPTEVTKRS
jgi:hypothetical protein